MYYNISIYHTNSDFILVSQLNNNNIQILANEYVLGNCSRTEFIEIYKKSIPNHGFLLINNSSTKNNDINEIYGIMRVRKELKLELIINI